MEIQKPVIIYALWQFPLILLIALIIGLGFNQFRSNRLPLFCNWADQQSQLNASISITEAARLFQQNKAVFLDARPVDFFEKGHIQGALSLPWHLVDEKFIQIMDTLPPDCTIITYCDGPACDLSHLLAQFMKDMGYEDVHVLVNGWALWNQQKLPVQGTDLAGGH